MLFHTMLGPEESWHFLFSPSAPSISFRCSEVSSVASEEVRPW